MLFTRVGQALRGVALVAAAVLIVGRFALAQRRFTGANGLRADPPIQNLPYDGRFTFARIRYTTGPGGYYYGGLPAWAHGYVSVSGGSRAEDNLMKIMNEISLLNAHVDGSVVLALDDPELFKYPVSYMTEAGFWTMTDQEAAAFHAYLSKGGFVIFDDFRDPPRGGGGWENFEENMQRVVPGARFVDMDPAHPIFNSFFKIDALDVIPQMYDQGRPIIRGLFEDNDPKKRLMAIVNFNTDVSDFWEFSATGFRPVAESNEAYKLGVNYIIYGMTH